MKARPNYIQHFAGKDQYRAVGATTAGPAMAIPVPTLQKYLLHGHAQKLKHLSETSAVRSLVPSNPRTSGNCTAKHECATRAHPDN